MTTLIALVPLAVALLTLGGLSWSARRAGLATLAAALLVTLLPCKFYMASGQSLLGLAEALAAGYTVLSVLFPGLLLHHIQRQADSLRTLAGAVAHLGRDRDLQVLLLVLGLAPWVESASGFGVGTIVVIPVLLAIGLGPVQAGALGLISQVAVPWGALAVGTAYAAELTGLDPRTVGIRTAILTAPLPALYGLAALWIAGGPAAMRKRWGAALVGGTSMSAGLWFFSRAVGIELAGIISSSCCLALLSAWGRLVTAGGGPSDDSPDTIGKSIPGGKTGLLRAMVPYLLLVALILPVRLSGPLQDALRSLGTIRLPSGMTMDVLSGPGVWVLVGALSGAVALRLRIAQVLSATGSAWRQFLPGATAILCFLAAAQLMRRSGMTAEVGNAVAAMGGHYCWMSPWLGAIGGWLTGSNTGSNALFASLQNQVGERAGLPAGWLVSGQNAAGSQAAMVSPARTILAAMSAGLGRGEATLLRIVGPIIVSAEVVIMVLLARIVLSR